MKIWTAFGPYSVAEIVFCGARVVVSLHRDVCEGHVKTGTDSSLGIQFEALVGGMAAQEVLNTVVRAVLPLFYIYSNVFLNIVSFVAVGAWSANSVYCTLFHCNLRTFPGVPRR